MCGRYFFDENIAMEQYHRLLERKYDQTVLDLWSTGEIYPGSVDLVLTAGMEPELMRWGMNLFSRKIINSRLESIRDKEYYQDMFRLSRCVIPASGFYEWDSQKGKHYIRTADPVIYLAGIYQQDQDLPSYSVITRPATFTAHIHDRSPVIMNRQQADEYLQKPSIDKLLSYDPAITVESEQLQLDLW